MMANLACDLIKHERIMTTTPKAKMLRSYADKMVTLGKEGTLAARRRAMAFLRQKEVVTKLFEDVAGRFTGRNGGYTRLLKAGVRPGDSSPMSLVELVEMMEAPKPEAKPAKKAKAEPKAETGEAAEEKPVKKAKPAAEKKPVKVKADTAKRAGAKPGKKKPTTKEG
jgi:large subunit ribosomal protein L17